MFQVAVISLCSQFHVVCNYSCSFLNVVNPGVIVNSLDVRPVLNCLVPRRCTSETKSCVLGISGGRTSTGLFKPMLVLPPEIDTRATWLDFLVWT